MTDPINFNSEKVEDLLDYIIALESTKSGENTIETTNFNGILTQYKRLNNK
jgi:hypothetical protein